MCKPGPKKRRRNDIMLLGLAITESTTVLVAVSTTQHPCKISSVFNFKLLHIEYTLMDKKEKKKHIEHTLPQ